MPLCVSLHEKGPRAEALGLGVRLFAVNGVVAQDDGGDLCPGGGALGGQLAVYAVHQLLFHGPGHGDLGVLADGFGVGITGHGTDLCQLTRRLLRCRI